MQLEIAHLWVLVIATSALAAWWLAVRPGSSYRGAGNTISVLIVLMAALMSILAVRFCPPSQSAAQPPTVALRY